MLVSSDTWTAYGIRTAPEESFELQNLNHLAGRASAPRPSLIKDTFTAAAPTATLISAPASPAASQTTINTSQTTSEFSPAVPLVPLAPPAKATSLYLSPAAIAGLCIGIGALVGFAAWVVLEMYVLRQRRRERNLRRAVEEVENGSIRSDIVKSEVKSRERFVGNEKEMRTGDEEGWEMEESRKGLSLPRRVW